MSIDKEKDGKLEILFRFIGIISLALIIYEVSQEPTIISGSLTYFLLLLIHY